jgi:hypothetical protein
VIEENQVSTNGKKIGKYSISTVLAQYNLDVRVDMERDLFVILVPDSPGDGIVTIHGHRNYKIFEAPTLAGVKDAVKAYLNSRDTTTFVDVIEYTCNGIDDTRLPSGTANNVGFDFRVARVSVARDKYNQPKLEIPVDVDEAGGVTVTEAFGELCRPEAHHYHHESSMPFTPARWRMCRAIRDGIASIGKMLSTLLGEDGDIAGSKLDEIRGSPLLLASLMKDDEKSQSEERNRHGKE